MSGGQHNPNGRQTQLGPAWNPLQLQMASYLARAPAAHLTERGVTWHTPTPPHLYHVPAPEPPDPLQAMKAGGAGAFRHTPPPPDKHLLRHTPSPGDPKTLPADLFPLLARDKHAREDVPYDLGGVDLTLRAAANGAAPALSVRDAPTINSLVGRRPARVDALLERLAAPLAVAPRAPATAAEDDAPDAAKRKRKPERTVRLPAPPPPAASAAPRENGAEPSPPRARRKSRCQSSETIDDIAAMIAEPAPAAPAAAPADPAPPDVSTDKLQSVLASPEPEPAPAPPRRRSSRLSNPEPAEAPDAAPVAPAAPAAPVAPVAPAAPAAPAETAAPAPPIVHVEDQLKKMFEGLEEQPADPADPAAAPAVEDPAPAAAPVDEPAPAPAPTPVSRPPKARKRRAGAAGARGGKARRRADDPKKPPKKAGDKKRADRDAYDSGSNASSGRSRGPYVQVRGAGARPVSVSVINGGGSDEERREWRAPRPRGLHASTLGARYDAASRDRSWTCALCLRGPHAAALGDLFGPYGEPALWLHEECGVWAPGVLAAGARVWGLAAAVRAARDEQCGGCRRGGAALACAGPRCPRRAHRPCAADWLLLHDEYRALCPQHRPPPPPPAPPAPPAPR